MKERPILFSGPMVKAILEGRKTQTRRVLKPQPPSIKGQQVWPNKNGDWSYWIDGSFWQDVKCFYGVPGNRLWVRETFAKNIPWCPHGLTYRVDHIDARGDGPAHPIKWCPSIFMSRWASRITLEITGIRVERVQDISDDDAKAEGVMDIGIKARGGYRSGFADLWDSTNAKRGLGWEQNPWVWVIEFKVL